MASFARRVEQEGYEILAINHAARRIQAQRRKKTDDERAHPDRD